MGSSVSANRGCLLLGVGLVLVLAALDFAAATGACSGTVGLDYAGGKVVNDGKSEITDSDAECCQKCSARSDCNYWTRVLYDDQGSKRGECWLRNWITWEHLLAWAHSSGEKKGACSGTAGLDFADGEIVNDGKKEITKTDRECCQKCNSRSDCNYWSRVIHDLKGGTKGECWLRKSIGYTLTQKWAVSSGEKKGTKYIVTSCTIESWIAFGGAQYLNDGEKDVVASAGECCAKCDARSDCKYWERHRSGGQCWLISSKNQKFYYARNIDGGEKRVLPERVADGMGE